MNRAALTPGIVGGGLVILVWLFNLIVISGGDGVFRLVVGVVGLTGAIVGRRSPVAAGVLQLIAGLVALLLDVTTLVLGIVLLSGRGAISGGDALVMVLTILGVLAGVLLIVGAIQAFRQRRRQRPGRLG